MRGREIDAICRTRNAQAHPGDRGKATISPATTKLKGGRMSSENAVVNWDSLLEDWNSIKKIKFNTPKEMLAHVYATEGTYKKTGKVFLLSAPTIQKYMKDWGIKHLPKGHRGESLCLKAIRGLGDVSALTVKQIAEQTGFSGARVGFLLGKHGIKHNKLRK